MLMFVVDICSESSILSSTPGSYGDPDDRPEPEDPPEDSVVELFATSVHIGTASDGGIPAVWSSNFNALEWTSRKVPLSYSILYLFEPMDSKTLPYARSLTRLN